MSSGNSVFLLRLLLILCLLSVSFSDEANVMLKLLSSVSPEPSGWSSSEHHCTWTNVLCVATGNVRSINLDSLSISGQLPSNLNQLASLQKLSIQKNSLSGRLPSFAYMPELRELYLDSNQFGSIPTDFLLGLPSLQTFSISDNGYLSPWKIPSYLKESSKLESFYASKASIFGDIPDFFDSFPNLRDLRLSYNNLTGSLPLSIGSSGIQRLWLNNQMKGLSGTIDVLFSMIQLSQAWLHSNAFTGPIPDLSKCQNLFDLQLGDNRFTGVAPVSITALPKLVNITLQNNNLQGPMPQFGDNVKANLQKNNFCRDTPGPCDPQVTALLAVAGAVGYPMILSESWKGNDACQNWAFITCDSQGKNVTGVNLSKQSYSGTISPALADLTSLKNLFLNDNNLTGPIPVRLTTLPILRVINVCNNNLSAPAPVFPSNVTFSHVGNLFLGDNVTTNNSGSSGNGTMTTDSGSSGNGTMTTDSGSSGTSNSNPNSNRSSIWTGMIVGVVIGVVIVIVVVLFVFKKCYMRGSVERLTGKNPDRVDHVKTFPNQENGNNVAISVHVLRKATNFFDPKNVLGSGGYGFVYKGNLDDGTKVAVKRMNDGAACAKGMKEFEAEIALLTKVRHRNLVALLGYCINEKEKLLVHEYMAKGTLGRCLFQWKKHGFDPLTWKQRVTIALDVARGIEYLHSLAHQSFIHRDIKSSNILLNDEMRAKVADFGLVRKAPNDKSYIETRVAGTFGYLAPEYARRVTTKVDVYAFGVVLMELITGKKAVDETLPEEMCHLVTWFNKFITKSQNLQNVLDPTLCSSDRQTLEDIARVVELASHCTTKTSSQRPGMEHVVNVLVPLVKNWKTLRPQDVEQWHGGHSLDLHKSLSVVFDDSSSQSVSFNLYQSAHF